MGGKYRLDGVKKQDRGEHVEPESPWRIDGSKDWLSALQWMVEIGGWTVAKAGWTAAGARMGK